MTCPVPDSFQAGFKDRFFDYFKQKAAALQEQIDQLSEISTAGGERVDAVNHSLAAIAKLQRQVSDASSQLPAHNQKYYSDQIKQLNDRLQKARESFAPRQKFSFKKAGRITSATSSTAPTPCPPASLSQPPPASHGETMDEPPTDDEGEYNHNLRSDTAHAVRSPSFSKAKSINLQDLQDMHIILPASSAPAMTTGSIRNINHCVIDISIPWLDNALKDTSFATMNITNITDSLILTGSVKGATHVTGMRNCVLVTSTGQLRMHQCENVHVYVRCGSEPIIEHCRDMHFAPLPRHYTPTTPTPPSPDKWNAVQDFQWLKAEHSPHWSELPVSERVPERVWREIVPGSREVGMAEVMEAVGMGR